LSTAKVAWAGERARASDGGSPSGGQRTVKVSVLHEKGDLIAQAVTQISKEIQQMCAITERGTAEQRWTLLLTRLLRRWLGGKCLSGLPEEAELLLSG